MRNAALGYGGIAAGGCECDGQAKRYASGSRARRGSQRLIDFQEIRSRRQLGQRQVVAVVAQLAQSELVVNLIARGQDAGVEVAPHEVVSHERARVIGLIQSEGPFARESGVGAIERIGSRR